MRTEVRLLQRTADVAERGHRATYEPDDGGPEYVITRVPHLDWRAWFGAIRWAFHSLDADLALPGPGGPGGSTPAAATHRGRVASVDSFRCHRGTRADGRSDPCSRAGGLAERKCVRFECGSRGESPAGVRSPRPPLPLGWEWGPAAAGEHRLANLAFVDEAPAEGSLASNQETAGSTPVIRSMPVPTTDPGTHSSAGQSAVLIRRRPLVQAQVCALAGWRSRPLARVMSRSSRSRAPPPPRRRDRSRFRTDPHLPAAQDAALSPRRRRFEPGWGHQSVVVQTSDVSGLS